MKVKPIDQVTEKWTRVTAQRTADYEAGINNPRADWATATAASESNYEQGIQQAISDKRFGKGVKNAGTTAWQQGAIQKGVTRWPAGVAVAGPKYTTNFGPFLQALERTTLPPRRPRRDPANLMRVNKVVETMISTAKAQAK